MKKIYLSLISFFVFLQVDAQPAVQGFPPPEYYRNFDYGSTLLEKYESKAAALYRIGSIIRYLQGVKNTKELNIELKNAVEYYDDYAEKLHDEYVAKSKSDITIDQWIADIKNLRDNDEVFKDKVLKTLDISIQEGYANKKAEVQSFRNYRDFNTKTYPMYELMGMLIFAVILVVFRNKVY